MRPVTHIAEERFIDLRVLVQLPIIHHQHQLLINLDVISALQNQRSVRSTGNLI
jgi:hypothetical protein